MIPTIETIVEDLAAGLITKSQAIAWLHQHAEGAANDYRDDTLVLMAQALVTRNGGLDPESTVAVAKRLTQAILQVRDEWKS